MNNYAHLKSDSSWRSVFPNGMVPIKNWLLARQGTMEGDNGDRPQEFYDVDLAKLTESQFDGIVKTLSQQSGAPVIVVRNGIKAQGTLPLRASHVSGTSSDCPAFL